MRPTWTEVIEMLSAAYKEGFSEGMKEHSHHDGGKPWYWSEARKAVEAKIDAASTVVLQERGGQ